MRRLVVLWAVICLFEFPNVITKSTSDAKNETSSKLDDSRNSHDKNESSPILDDSKYSHDKENDSSPILDDSKYSHDRENDSSPILDDSKYSHDKENDSSPILDDSKYSHDKNDSYPILDDSKSSNGCSHYSEECDSVLEEIDGPLDNETYEAYARLCDPRCEPFLEHYVTCSEDVRAREHHVQLTCLMLRSVTCVLRLLNDSSGTDPRLHHGLLCNSTEHNCSNPCTPNLLHIRERYGCCPLVLLNSSLEGNHSFITRFLENCERDEKEVEEYCRSLMDTANFTFIHPNVTRDWLPRTHSLLNDLRTRHLTPTSFPRPWEGDEKEDKIESTATFREHRPTESDNVPDVKTRTPRPTVTELPKRTPEAGAEQLLSAASSLAQTGLRLLAIFAVAVAGLSVV